MITSTANESVRIYVGAFTAVTGIGLSGVQQTNINEITSRR